MRGVEMKSKKIEIPDYTDIEILEDEDLIKLGDTILETLKKKLGKIEANFFLKTYLFLQYLYFLYALYLKA